MNIRQLNKILLGVTLTLTFITISVMTVYIRSLEEDKTRDSLYTINTSSNCSDILGPGAKSTPFPRIVHQTWKSYSVPAKWLRYRTECRRLNPDYNFTLWNDADLEKFIASKYPWFLSTYKGYPYHIERVDSARYFILHYYGGVYIDLDIRCKLPFDDILQQVPADGDTVLGATAPLGVTNSMMISKPRHPFMLFTISRLQSVNRWYVFPYFTIMLSTGPLMVWRTYKAYPCKENVLVLTVEDHTQKYFAHTHGSTWKTWDDPIWRWIGRHGTLSVALVLLFLVTAVAGYLGWKPIRRVVQQRRYSTVIVKIPDKA